jgi:hypothetical protein
MDPEERIVTQSAGARLALMAESFVRLTGETLVEASPSLAQALWSAPRAIVAHGTEADPIFFYGNRMALDLFEMSATDFLRLPRACQPRRRAGPNAQGCSSACAVTAILPTMRACGFPRAGGGSGSNRRRCGC